MDKENLELKVPNDESVPSRLAFPNEFPYEFDSPSFSSAFTSPADSTETEESSDDEEDFLAGLTRRLALSTQLFSCPGFATEKTVEKSRITVSSPQSTLSRLGSWSASGSGSPNGSSSIVRSPPTTPFFGKDDTWDVIYAAAGQVARLKMSSQSPLSHPNPRGRTLLHPSRTPDLLLKPGETQNAAFYPNTGLSQNYVHKNQYMSLEEAVKEQCFSVWGSQARGLYHQTEPKYQTGKCQTLRRGCGNVRYESGKYARPLELPLPALPAPPLPQQRHSAHSHAAAMRFPARSGARSQCAGTGVFLPRRYTNPSDSRKKSGCNVHFPGKVVQALNLNFDDMTGYTQPQRFSADFCGSDYDSAMARRNALLIQHRRSLRTASGAPNQGIPLPQEWMY